MLERFRTIKFAGVSLLALLLSGTGQAQIATDAEHQAPWAESRRTTLPPEVASLLARAKLPADALAAVVLETRPDSAPLLAWRADAPVNPASTLKLVTTYAALDRLGPDFRWQTRVYSDGTVRDGTLHGDLYLQGGGD
ncbi:MAG: D-alanyl-D-alanine carboxypeptidase/D-alanyl-D-alanine-endopeptidase, partial [Pseudomonadota bacterium]